MIIYPPVKYEPEILEPKIIVTSGRPFGTETVYAEAPTGLSISQILWSGPCPRNLPVTIEAWIDGKPVPRELWDVTYPKVGQLVAFKALPRGSVWKTILQVLILIVAVVLTIIFPEAAPFIWVGATLANIAVSFIKTATPRNNPAIDFNSTNDAPTQWISGAQNSINKWGSIPVILGTDRTTPFYGAKLYTEIVGNDQFLRVLFVVGYGPLQITNLKLGEAAIDTFNDVQIEVRSGYDTDDPITLIPNQIDELGLQVLLSYGVWNSRTTEPDCDSFSVDWSFPSGLVALTPQGAEGQCAVWLEIHYRKVGDEEWTEVGENLNVPAKQTTFQPSYTTIQIPQSVTIPVSRTDAICVRCDSGEVQIFQGVLLTPPQIDTINYYELAEVVILGSDIYSITDKRNSSYVTGCEVTVSSGLAVNIASGTILDINRGRTVAASKEAVRRTLTIIPPERGQYEVEVRRVSADSDSTLIADKVYWIVLRSIKA